MSLTESQGAIVDPPCQVAIVGMGPAGGLVARLLAEAGLEVTGLEMGPWRDARTFSSNEWEMRELWWPEWEYRLTGSAARGRVNSGLGVGGGGLVWTGAAWRLFPHDFRVRSEEGDIPGALLADWPITYDELSPYYTAVEQHIGVAGVRGPFDPPGLPPLPFPPHPYHRHTEILQEGFNRLGLRTQPGSVAILPQSWLGREACNGCGYCIQGCHNGAMYSSLAELPAALESGHFHLRTRVKVTRLLLDPSGRRVQALALVDLSTGERHLCPVELVVVAANPIETARLLLASAHPRHPLGLANQSGLVGRCLTVHPGPHVWGVFPEIVEPEAGFVLNHLACFEFSRATDSDPYRRGFILESLTGLPAGVATGPLAALWGEPLMAAMRRYRHMAGLFVLCEGLPQRQNGVYLLDSAPDPFRLPPLRVHYDWHPNDLAMIARAQAVASSVLKAAGAATLYLQTPVQVHMMGTARMGRDPADSVADSTGRTHTVENLYLAGGSLFPTGSSVNPTLTILALAWRTAEAIAHAAGVKPGRLSGAWTTLANVRTARAGSRPGHQG